MFRTLLRTLPSLSGNVKLNVNLERDYNINNKDIVTKVNKAFLTTAGQDKNYFVYNVNLLNSRWDYDLREFYSFYSDKFYRSSFSFDKTDINVIDKYNTVKQRDVDYEFGVARLDYNIYNNQYSFFAPIYVDNIFDLPNRFEISLKYTLNGNIVLKRIIVPLRPEDYSGIYGNDNILYNYLYRYIKNVDQKIINISGENIKYYGIDLIRGGFNEYIQPVIAKQLFNTLNPLQKTDSLITSGFKLSRSCVKQIIPITFNFNINDLFDPVEASRMAFTHVTFTGAYKYTDNMHQEVKGTDLPLFDFDINVDELYLNNLIIDYKTLKPITYNNKSVNVLNQGFPGLHDSEYYKYKLSNRVSPNYTRWRIQKTNKSNNSVFDSDNYIVNFSAVFNNVDNNYYFNTINIDKKINNAFGVCNIIKYFSYNNAIKTPFDNSYTTEYIDINNLLLPYNDIYYPSDYSYSDYYKAINGYDNYINNRKTLKYDHFNTIYLSNEYLGYTVSAETGERNIDLLSKHSYTDGFNLSYIIDDSYNYSLFSDQNNTNCIFDKTNKDYNVLWHTPVNGTVFYNGVLYDLNSLVTENSYGKYVETLNDEKYDHIALTNKILDYLVDKNYESWLKTQKVTKFGVFNLPVPCMSLIDNELNTAAVSLSYTYKNATQSVNFNRIFDCLTYNDNKKTTYIPVYEVGKDTMTYNAAVSYNVNVIKTQQTLSDIDLTASNNNLYISAEELLTNVVNPEANKNKYYIDNEYIIINNIFDDVAENISACHKQIENDCQFLDKVKLPFEVNIGVHGFNGPFYGITLNKIKEFLDTNGVYKQSFKQYTGLENIESLNSKIFNCVYDLLVYYFININSSNIPACMIDNNDVRTIFEKLFYGKVSSKRNDVTLLINKFNIKNTINDDIIDADNINYQLANLYIKQFGSDDLTPVTFSKNKNYFINNNVDINNSLFAFKGNVCLKQDIILNANKILFAFNSDTYNENIINSLGKRYVFNDDIINDIKNIYGWLVSDNCAVLNLMLEKVFNSYLQVWINKQTYYDNIDYYISTTSAKIANMVFEDYKNCLNYINELYIDEFNKINEKKTTSFLLINDEIINKINTQSVYTYKSVYLSDGGDLIARDVFVQDNDVLYNSQDLVFVSTFNLNKLGDGFFRTGLVENYTKTLYSLFVSKEHLQNYMQYLSADKDGEYKIDDKAVTYNQWVALCITDYNGPFQNLFVAENKIIYNESAANYDALNRYIPIKDYLVKNVYNHIKKNNESNARLNDALGDIHDDNERSEVLDGILSEATSKALEFFYGYDLFSFINDLRYNPNNYTFTFTRKLGSVVSVKVGEISYNIDIYIDSKNNRGEEIPFSVTFLLTHKGDYLPVTSEILVNDWGLFDNDGNIVNYIYNNKSNVDFYFYSPFTREDIDGLLDDYGNKAEFIRYGGEEYTEYENSVWSQTGTLRPLFNTYKTENLTHTKLYSETILNNIKSFIYKDDYLFKEGGLMFKYVKNSSLDTIIQLNSNMCSLIGAYISKNPDDKNILGLTVYKLFYTSNIFIENSVHTGNKYDELGLFNKNKLYTHYHDGENYGFYINFIRLSQNIINSIYKFTTPLTYDENSKKITGNYTSGNSFLSVNNVPLIEVNDNKVRLSVSGTQYMCSKLVDLLYFNQNVLIDIINNINTLKLPYTYKINSNLESVLIKDKLSDNNYYTIIKSNNNYNYTVMRYGNYIEPNFTRVDSNNYIYNIKFKETDTKLLKYYKYGKSGDSPVYKTNGGDIVNIYGIETPDRLMFDSEWEYNNVLTDYNNGIYYNNIIEKFTPFEVKGNTCSRYYVLPQKITFPLAAKYTYDKLINLDTYEVRLTRFIKYCEDVYGFNDRKEILFLFNRYSSSLEFVADGLDEYQKNKVYSGNFIFILK